MNDETPIEDGEYVGLMQGRLPNIRELHEAVEEAGIPGRVVKPDADSGNT